MEFKYSMSIFFSHMGYIFKILLWLIISIGITAAVGAAIFVPLCGVIGATTDAVVYVDAIQACIKSVLSGDLSVRAAIGDALPLLVNCVKAVGQNVGAAVGAVFGFIGMYAVYTFMIGLSQYTISDIINNIMASNMRFGFASNMVMNIKRCAKYSLARLAITLPVDLLIFAIMAAMLLGLFSMIKFFSLPIILLFGIIALSLRATALAGWLPRMLYHKDEKVYTALTRSFTFVKYNFKGLIKAFVITYSIIYLIFVAFAIPTGGLLACILPPIYYFVLRAVELVGHYKTHGSSFYTDANTVINTVEFGYRNNQDDVDGE